jgi:predicted secreted protein
VKHSPNLAVLTLAAAAVLLATPDGARAQTQPATPPPQNVVNLMASASTEVTMDILQVVFASTREGNDAAAVQSQLKQALDAALAEARKVAKPGQVDVQTGAFSLYPRYASKGAISGWQGRAELIVEGRDTAAIAQLTGRITSLTIARVGYNLSREARQKVEAEVTTQSIARFRERALAYAQQFGFAGFTIREVQVGTDNPATFAAAPMARARMSASAQSDESLPVEAGKATVSASVSGSVQMTK